jgi:hypothetical protein
MNKRTQAWALMIVIAAFFAGPSRAAEDSALLKDMTSVIALLGQPCGQVVSVVKQGDNDHIATCQDGNRYRVFLNAEGRVVAQKQ